MVNGKHGPRNSSRLSARSKLIMHSAISLHGIDGRLKQVTATIRAQCAEEGIAAPAKATIHNHLMLARGEQRVMVEEPLIAVGELLVALPCLTEHGELVRPRVLAAVECASRRVLCFRVVPETVKSNYAQLLDQVRNDGHTVAMVTGHDRKDEIGDADAKRWGLDFESRGSIWRRLRCVFGSRLDGLSLIYREKAAAPPEHLLIRKKGRAISFAVAVEAIELAVRQHNNKWPHTALEFQEAA
jgi:hypothetical protein